MIHFLNVEVYLFQPYLCIRLAALRQLKQASLRSICTIFAFEFNFFEKEFRLHSA